MRSEEDTVRIWYEFLIAFLVLNNKKSNGKKIAVERYEDFTKPST